MKADVVSAAVKERLPVPEGIESVLVGYGVRGAAVRTAAEAEHGALAGIVQVGGKRSQSALREYVPHREVFSIPVRWGVVCRIAGGTMPDLRLWRCFLVRVYRVGAH